MKIRKIEDLFGLNDSSGTEPQGQALPARPIPQEMKIRSLPTTNSTKKKKKKSE